MTNNKLTASCVARVFIIPVDYDVEVAAEAAAPPVVVVVVVASVRVRGLC